MSDIYNGMRIIRRGTTNPGTLGGFFTFGGDEIFGISNNHVLANLGQCKMGDKICKSGSQIVVGSLQCWIDINSDSTNYLDVALFKLAPDARPYWRMLLDDKTVPREIRMAEEGERVYMVTNNGSNKQGIVSQLFIDKEYLVSLGDNEYAFTGLSEVTSLSGSPFSEPGESGSLVFSIANNDVLGVLMGTNENNKARSYYVPFVHDNLGICAVYPSIEVWNPYKNFA